MRAFIAIDFDHSIKENIVQMQQAVQSHAIAGRWKRADNFHLTLKFLGEITPGEMDRISISMSDVASRHEPFELYLGKIGFFKGHGVLRVVWLGIEGEKDVLNALQRDVEQALVSLGINEDNRFSPHITLGQDVKLDVPFEQLRDDICADAQPIYIKSFYLMDSRVIKGQRVYTPIRQFELSRR